MNFYKANGGSYNYVNIFLKIPDYLVYCINLEVEEKDHIKSLLLSKKCSVYDCSSNFKSKRKKTIINSNICINDCSEINNYEYNYYCYPECPVGTKASLEKEYQCETIENNNYEIEKNETITYNNTFNNHLIKETKTYQNLKVFQDSINNYIDKINDREFDSIILNIIMEKIDYYIIEDNNIIIELTSLTFLRIQKIIFLGGKVFFMAKNLERLNKQNDNEKDNISSLYIEKDCENLLKVKYNINMNETLILFKYDYYIPGIKIPIIGYEIFHPITKEKLNLNYCNKNNIKLSLPVKINEEEIFKYDPNNDFYKDLCSSYINDKGVDLTLYDRKNEYNYYNMSICPKNCKYDDYNNLTKKVTCQSNEKFNNSILLFEDIINKDKLLNNFIDIKTISNIGIIKCFKKVISFEGLKSNIGSYILLMIIFLLSFLSYIIKENYEGNTMPYLVAFP